MTHSNPGPTPVAQGAVASGRGLTAASGPQRLVIEDWVPEALANGQHGHWSTRQRKLRQAQDYLWYSAHGHELQPYAGRVRLTVTLVFPQNRRRDTDNLYSRVKGVVDGLVKGGWIEDDDNEHLELIVRAEVRPGVKQTELLLEPLPSRRIGACVCGHEPLDHRGISEVCTTCNTCTGFQERQP